MPLPDNAQKPTATSAEQARLKKEERDRRRRRRNRQFIGLALTVLIVVGAGSIIMNGIQLVQNLRTETEDLEEYRKKFETFVWFDVLPFESVTQLDENMVKQVCIWGVYTENVETLERDELGRPLIPVLDVDKYATGLFGPEFRFSGHETFMYQAKGLMYEYDPERELYIGQATGLEPDFLPVVKEVIRESGGIKRVVMGYVSLISSDNQVVATPDYEHPAKYMDFMMRRDGSEYYLYALVPNTTYAQENQPASIPQEEQPEEPSEPEELPGDSSLAEDSASPDEAGQDSDPSQAEDDSSAAA